MTTATSIRRLGEHVARGMTLLAWYYRTHPETRRFLAAPALAAFLVMLLTVIWGLSAMTLLVLVVVGTFAVFAVPFIDEIRSLERVNANLEAGPVPWLAGVAKEAPEPPSEAPAFQADQPRPAIEIAAVAPSLPVSPAVSADPAYELIEVTAGRRIARETSTALLDAFNVASELVEETNPEGLEIMCVTGDERETVWRYSRAESAAEPEQPGLVDIFGFDPASWAGPPRTSPPRER